MCKICKIEKKRIFVWNPLFSIAYGWLISIKRPRNNKKFVQLSIIHFDLFLFLSMPISKTLITLYKLLHLEKWNSNRLLTFLQSHICNFYPFICSLGVKFACLRQYVDLKKWLCSLTTDIQAGFYDLEA